VTEIVVVGGGPAGSAAAAKLARAGRQVIIVDKAEFPRDKCCGDGLTTLALRELEALALDPRAVPTWQVVTEVCLRSPSGREVDLALPGDGTFAVTAPRRELDAALIDVAVAAGAAARLGTALRDVDPHPDRVDVQLDDGTTISARYVIAADGMWSPTRRLLGLAESGYRGEWHAFRQYASGVTGPAGERLYVWFEPDLLPGYAWSFPLPDKRVNLGFGVLRSGSLDGGALKSLWVDLLDRPHIAAALGDTIELEDRHAAWPIPAAIDEAVLAHGRVLFVGDAARASDVLTGEGIGQALVTGRLAAEAILSAGALRADLAERRYREAVDDELFADHRMSRLLNRALAHPRAARGALRLVDSTQWNRRMFARWMFEDEPRAIPVTPRRWHRRMLARTGPYRPPAGGGGAQPASITPAAARMIRSGRGSPDSAPIIRFMT
jgi:menaquinone-9 beta-reductase